MSAPNRAALLTKTHKVLKKHYDAVAPPADRSVLEHLLYACCLENSRHAAVDDVFAQLQARYFDWNEVRVTTVSELAEVMGGLNDPADSARRLKSTLHSVFETHYAFDVDFLRKQNLGKAVKEIEKFKGVTPFTIAYVTQNALGGHAIAVNRGVLAVLTVLGVITPAEAEKQRAPGMERAIPKSKGVEFASLLHQFGVDFASTPYSPRLRSIVLDIAPDAKDRLPKRPTKKETTRPKQKKAAKKKPAATPAAKVKKTTAKSTSPAAKKKKSTTKRLSRKKPR